jgi:antitoxin (DNA-binding transcriptional repressor) of toxin-antitoxin stability system
MIGNMAQVHITEAELAQNLHAVLQKVRNGEEVVIEHEHRPFAIIRAPEEPGRPIDECIAIAKAYEERLGYAPLPDADFAADVQAAIDAHREPLNPPAWD